MLQLSPYHLIQKCRHAIQYYSLTLDLHNYISLSSTPAVLEGYRTLLAPWTLLQATNVHLFDRYHYSHVVCVGSTTARVSNMTESAQPHISTSVGRSLFFYTHPLHWSSTPFNILSGDCLSLTNFAKWYVCSRFPPVGGPCEHVPVYTPCLHVRSDCAGLVGTFKLLFLSQRFCWVSCLSYPFL